jgi:hypothetical protein
MQPIRCWNVRPLGKKGCEALLLGLIDGTIREVWLTR